jgi:6-phosphogluconolactonase
MRIVREAMSPRDGVQSRREFLAVSAAGVLSVATGTARPARREQVQPESELLYVGTYTEGKREEGIFVLRLDTRTGQLQRVSAVSAGANPSFLAVHPNGRVLYAVNEVTERDGKASGGVSAFSIAPESGALTRLNDRPSEGGAPCYISVDRTGRSVLVANYVGGNIALLPVQQDGRLGPARHVVQHRGGGPISARQEAAHAHYIAPDVSNRFALAADLGVDRVMVYRLDLDEGMLQLKGEARMPPGSGPRHLAFHPTLPWVFVANELNSTVSTLRFDNQTGTLEVLRTRSTLPAGATGTNYPADIHVSPSGRTVYVSNRGNNSIAVFSVSAATGTLALEQVVSTEGDWPRNFTLDPTGQWLLVANQRSGTIVVFQRDRDSGRLTLTPQRMALPAPVCLRFLSSTG